MLASASQPYSRAGLEALQKSLKLHSQLCNPIIWVDPTQNQLRLKDLDRPNRAEELDQ